MYIYIYIHTYIIMTIIINIFVSLSLYIYIYTYIHIYIDNVIGAARWHQCAPQETTVTTTTQEFVQAASIDNKQYHIK